MNKSERLSINSGLGAEMMLMNYESSSPNKNAAYRYPPLPLFTKIGGTASTYGLLVGLGVRYSVQKLCFYLDIEHSVFRINHSFAEKPLSFMMQAGLLFKLNKKSKIK